MLLILKKKKNGPKGSSAPTPGQNTCILIYHKGGFQKNKVFFKIKAELISFIHIRSHLYLKCVF